MNKKKKPCIRFKGFTDDWEQRKLGDIVQITMGQSPNGETYSEKPSDYILVQGMADLKVGWVFPRVWTTQKTKTCDAGDLIMSVRAPAGAVGKTAYSAVIGRGVSAIKGNEFIYQTLTKRYLDGCWKKIAAGSTFESINFSAIADAEIMLPSGQEQKRIGRFFSNLDYLITLHQRKCEKLKIIKKSMLENCFPKNGQKVPKIRFSGFTGDWEQHKLGELVIIERGGSPRPIENYITNAEDGLNWVKIGDAPSQGRYITHTTEKIKPTGLSKTRQVEPGDLILSNSMSFGKPYIMAISGCIHDGWLLIRNNQNIFDLKFLCHMLGINQMTAQYKAMAAGSTVNNLNKSLVSNSVITIPSKTEQRKIGALLESLDDVIALHQSKLEKLQKIKKSMLERMFV